MQCKITKYQKPFDQTEYLQCATCCFIKSGANWLFCIAAVMSLAACHSKESLPALKHRILVSTDIGGTDPDDNQSMIHLLMYSNVFEIEGLVSSPSYGKGHKGEILKAIDLYEKDLPALAAHAEGFPSADALRAITKQGRKGMAPYQGYAESTEGSDWIIHCAKREHEHPLWILVWGGLEDLAQALHDAPEIQDKIRVYWIGGPNKKWSVNSYCYIAQHFPDLWFIEANNSYYGFFSENLERDSLNNENYYHTFIRGAGHLGKDFKNYYDGQIKMGDTPSLLYLLHGNPDQPAGESWGGSFEPITHSTRRIYSRNLTGQDTVTLCSVLELHFQGPELDWPSDSSCFTMTVQAGIGEQKWAGYYLGKGDYAVRYAPKKSEHIRYVIHSSIPALEGRNGSFYVDNSWPGKRSDTDYPLGQNWYSDKQNPEWYDGPYQGAKTVLQGRNAALLDWAIRWKWLSER